MILVTKVSEREQAVLNILANHYENDEANCLYMSYIANELKLEISQVRRAVRSLARKGLAILERGLMDYDGYLQGGGYRSTSGGYELIKSKGLLEY